MLLHDNEEYRVHFGDSIPHMMTEMPPQSVDFCIYSPPFPLLYAYTSESCDVGNSEDFRTTAKIHLSFFYRGLRRVLKPGRVALVHCMQIPRLKREGGIGRGLHNFRDLNIRLAERAGLIYEYEWSVWKNPQAQAITTHSLELQFAGLDRDRARSRGVLPDFLIKLTAPGENAVPLDSEDQVSRSRWIDLAEHQWKPRKYPIGGRTTQGTPRVAYTLNTAVAKGNDDTRHICPLQLSIIHDAVLLFSDPGEVVFSPFAGIGSEGFPSLRLGRRFYGCEIKTEYYETSIKNLDRAIRMRDGDDQMDLPGFDGDENDVSPVDADGIFVLPSKPPVAAAVPSDDVDWL
jgi:DNA modification methylase